MRMGGPSGGSRKGGNRGFERRAHEFCAIDAGSNNRQELVRRQHPQNLDWHIVFRERRSLMRIIVRAASQRKDAELPADLRTTESFHLRDSQRPELTRAELDDITGIAPGQRSRLRARPW